MTPEQKSLVQNLWLQVLQIAGAALNLFYGKLFEIDPKLRKLFADGLISQKIASMAVIGRTVASLGRIESIVSEEEPLCVRHAGYRVTPNGFPIVGPALLWAPGQHLRDAWTLGIKETWTIAYMLLAGRMMSAGDSVTASPASPQRLAKPLLFPGGGPYYVNRPASAPRCRA